MESAARPCCTRNVDVCHFVFTHVAIDDRNTPSGFKCFSMASLLMIRVGSIQLLQRCCGRTGKARSMLGSKLKTPVAGCVIFSGGPDWLAPSRFCFLACGPSFPCFWRVTALFNSAAADLQLRPGSCLAQVTSAARLSSLSAPQGSEHSTICCSISVFMISIVRNSKNRPHWRRCSYVLKTLACPC